MVRANAPQLAIGANGRSNAVARKAGGGKSFFEKGMDKVDKYMSSRLNKNRRD